MQRNAVQCNAMQRNAMQCNAMQYNAMQIQCKCNTMQCKCNAMQCNANAMQRNAMQCSAMQCNAMQRNATPPLELDDQLVHRVPSAEVQGTGGGLCIVTLARQHTGSGQGGEVVHCITLRHISTRDSRSQ